MLAAAAEACSTRAAFSCVPRSIWPIASLISWLPANCSRLAAEISPMMSVTRWTRLTMSSMAAPAWSARRVPASIWPADSPISYLIRAAAAASCHLNKMQCLLCN